ncbi:MAG: site-specific integrase [Oscillospiraceae bacterium]|nr:site-specific integrase [Oscillospiraceae bacterium]
MRDDFILAVSPSAEYRVMPFTGSTAQFIADRRHIWSPATTRSYAQSARSRFPTLQDLPLDALTSHVIQEAIGLEAQKTTASTIHNGWALLHQVLDTYLPDAPRWRVRLPKRKPPDLFTPSDEDMQRLVDAMPDTFSEPTRFAALTGLRREEVCALHWDAVDLENRKLYVRRVLVQDENNNWHDLERTKTNKSRRVVDLPSAAIELLQALPCADERVFPLIKTPNSLSRAAVRTRKKVGLSQFRFHDTRRYRVTADLELGIPVKYLQEQVGHTIATQTHHYESVRESARAGYISMRDNKLRGLRKKQPKTQPNVSKT